jgi:predicted secreted protein
MASSAISAYGTLLKRESSPGSGTYVTVAEVKSMSGPSISVDVLDVTTHSSAASGAWKEKRPSLLDAGEISFPINLVPASAGHKQLLADMIARSLISYKIVFPDPGLTEWKFDNCFITKFDAKAETEGILEAEITLTLTGAPTFPA